MIEMDVLPERPDGSGRLLVAHDYDDLRERPGALTMEEGLDQLAATGLELNVDLKLPGYEDRVIEAIRARGLTDRVLVSTMERESLRRVRALAPELRLGWSVPRVRRNPFESRLLAVPAYAGLHVLRRALPRLAARAIRRGECDALMAHFLLVTPSLVRAVLDEGAELYVWTVDARERIDALRELGVSAIITNDPSLFGPAAV